MAKTRKPAAPKFIACTVREHPPEVRIEAARLAIDENPANAPHVEAVSRFMTPNPESLAALTTNYWRSGSVKRSVQFLGAGWDQSAKDLVLTYANKWADRGANVKYVETSSAGDVRVSRVSGAGGGYWSYVGTDTLSIPAAQATMNLEGVTGQLNPQEASRVICHEFGHDLGFQHEQLLPEIIARLDRQKVITYYRNTQGWSESQVVNNLLTPLDPALTIRTPGADAVSIMMYQIYGFLTLDGTPIPGGTKITDSDYSFAGKLYPGQAVPPAIPGATHVGPLEDVLVSVYPPGSGTPSHTGRIMKNSIQVRPIQ